MPLINGQVRGEVEEEEVGGRDEEGQFYEGCGRGTKSETVGFVVVCAESRELGKAHYR